MEQLMFLQNLIFFAKEDIFARVDISTKYFFLQKYIFFAKFLILCMTSYFLQYLICLQKFLNMKVDCHEQHDRH
jgi:hypothetical protein